MMNYENGVGVFDPLANTVKWAETSRIEEISLADLERTRGFAILTKENDDFTVEVEELSTSALRERLSALTRVKDTTAGRGLYKAKKKKEQDLALLIAKAMALAKERSSEENGNGEGSVDSELSPDDE
jgi:hypothetical protein